MMRPMMYSSLLCTAILAAACVTHLQGGSTNLSIVEYKLQISVGLRFSESEWSKPNGAVRKKLAGEGVNDLYEFSWKNGCSVIISVENKSDKISGWKYASTSDLCRNIKDYRFGT